MSHVTVANKQSGANRCHFCQLANVHHCTVCVHARPKENET
jgi:hypothetical protein